ncbi:hypothetical protein SAMN05421737_10596 [Shouchella lonarensis]|uniref:Uncharacterized protein n=1 Tax=Shouchella lonarensis TaxID=1464122 RepID=A0A1G6IKT1_9BACI|nr:hypothetical protein SAMN05421737_10596 [Shouchella lonarensis]
MEKVIIEEAMEITDVLKKFSSTCEVEDILSKVIASHQD